MASPVLRAGQRIGLSTIINLAKTLCRLNSEHGTKISQWFPNEPRITALLAAISALCAVLTPAQSAFDEAVVIQGEATPIDYGNLPGNMNV